MQNLAEKARDQTFSAHFYANMAPQANEIKIAPERNPFFACI